MTDSQPMTSLLDQGDSISISQLNPDISEPEKRVVCGTVTITWPFSILHKTVAFLLAERDFRLRRENGQVRVRFHGAAARAIADASLGAGDEIRVSLQGVKWEKNETHTQVAGSTLEWQLEFTNRLILGISRPETGQETILDIDVPTEEPETTTNDQADNTNSVDVLTPIPEKPATPTPQSPEVTLPAKRNMSSTLDPNEYASPAFLKRARVSYGSLFEGGMDTFDDDVSKKSKSKKRTRFSLPSNAWRYTSQSPSPEPEQMSEVDEEENQANGVSQPNGDTEDVPMDTPQRRAMVDQGVQTTDVDFTPMASVQVMAESRPAFGFAQLTPTPFARTRPFGADNSMMDQSLQFEGDSTTPHGMPLGSHQDLLVHSPNHVGTDMAFTYTPQAVLFSQAQGFLPEQHVQNTMPGSPTPVTGAEDYPPGLLDTDSIPPNMVDNLTSLAALGSQSDMAPHNPFVTESARSSTFNTSMPPPQNVWATEASPEPQSAIVSSDAEHPVEIMSSSPFREQGSQEPSESQQPSPSRDNTEINTTADGSPEPALEEPASEAEYYRDGGDEPGDDYDLRKYSRAHDDDDDVETSEEEPEVNNDDPEAQIMNPEEDDMDVDEDVENQEGYLDEDPEEYAEEMYERRSGDEGEEYEGSEGDAEGEYYSDEEDGYDDEEEEEYDEEAENRPSAPPVQQDPVFISLLSDSEDDEEPEQAPEPEPQSESEADSESVKDQDREPEPASEPEQKDETNPLLEPEAKGEIEDFKADEEMTKENDQPLLATEAKKPSEQGAKEADLDKETEDANEKQPAELENVSAPLSPAKDPITDDVEAAEAPAVSKANKDDDNSHRADETTEEQPTANLSTQNVPPIKEEEQREQETDREPSPAETELGDIDMDHGPAPVEESGESENEDVVPKEPTETDAPDEIVPVVAKEPVEAMDVDAPAGETNEDTVDSMETTVVEVVEASITVSEEASGTFTDVAQEASASVHVVTAQEEPLPEPLKTQENVDVPSNALASEEIASDDQATLETRGSQVPEASESHDAIMQDTSCEVTTQPAPQSADTLSETDHGKVEEANVDGKPIGHGQISPPPTQALETQVVEEDNINVSSEGHGEHLPTPGETQQVVEVEMVETLNTITQNNEVDDEDVDPEDQIMAEILQHSPLRQDAHPSRDPFMSSPVMSQAKSPPPAELTNEPHAASPGNDEPASEIFVAKSLRSRRNKSAKTSDENGAEDPSLALITNTSTSKTAERGSKQSSPDGSSSKTRSKTNHDDPSIQLAGGSVQIEAKNKRKRKAPDDESGLDADNSSPGSQRITRSKTDHGDPSILLAKGSSPSARQLRSHKTPDPKRETPRRETRSVSRSLQIREDSPDVSFTSLKSPSIAGSAGTVPEEEDVKTLKSQLVKGLRTNLPDFLSLKVVSRNSIDKMTDILAVVTQTPVHPHRPKHGPRDFMLTLSLTDPSTAPTQVRVAHIFRPHLASLPEVEAGDVILLRRVKVVSMKGRGFGVRSEDSSSWAVSKSNDKEILSQVKGPPVEITPEEIEYAKGLRQWWSLQDDSAMDKIETASRKVTEAGKENAK
ncbi:uncharacterized protein FTOL_10371 [Fusarium torulosum]|uniref:Telomeric single stranded DNA binding POT1/Cdc13 domain-containing protein n=1 Tax=Fusarium torulosum TaxID=33205 RepID=A0AAE8MGF3_9HYPO|nr:uncharacterized protein FTOL_10371 [Fusarium torulosum]